MLLHVSTSGRCDMACIVHSLLRCIFDRLTGPSCAITPAISPPPTSPRRQRCSRTGDTKESCRQCLPVIGYLPGDAPWQQPVRASNTISIWPPVSNRLIPCDGVCHRRPGVASSVCLHVAMTTARTCRPPTYRGTSIPPPLTVTKNIWI